MLKAAQAYFQTQVNTTSQGQLLLMLYDGGIKFLKQAKVKMAERDYAQKGILISKAIDVISELDSSLNIQRGGEVAQNLHNLYFFCNTRLLQANLRMDQQLVDEVIKVLSGLREAFAQIAHVAPAAEPAQVSKPVPSVGVKASTPLPTIQGNIFGAPHQNNAPQSAPKQAVSKPVTPEVAAVPAPKANGVSPAKPTPQAPPSPPSTYGAQAAPTAPANGKSEQEEQPEKPGARVTQSRLLAGSNIYKKMASQNQ